MKYILITYYVHDGILQMVTSLGPGEILRNPDLVQNAYYYTSINIL